MSADKQKLLVLIDWFDPAYKAGGPVRSIYNLVQHLQDVYHIYVLTSNRDLNGSLDVSKTDQWINHPAGAFQVCYITRTSYSAFAKQIKSIQPDFVYLNSMFSLSFSLMPIYWKWRHPSSKVQLVLAPRGMLKSSAIAFKPFKKKMFLFLFKFLGFPKLIRFQATDSIEYRDIKAEFGNVDRLEVSNFAGKVPDTLPLLFKDSGIINLLFVGRIHPIKNLDVVLDALQKVNGEVQLTIVGVLEDKYYWSQCCSLISKLPASINVNFLGDLPPTALEEQYNQHHAFVLPTKGENFGHAIFDAFAFGLPAIISNQTPWRNLEEKKAGWDIDLKTPDLFTQKIQELINSTD
jgi:glycosyltransferase involved in cell wall biosynthesis